MTLITQLFYFTISHFVSLKICQLLSNALSLFTDYADRADCHKGLDIRSVTKGRRRRVAIGVALVLPELHKSLLHVQTSAAPFLRHLLVPSSQHPRSNTTPLTYCLTQPLLLMRSLHSWTGSSMASSSSAPSLGP